MGSRSLQQGGVAVHQAAGELVEMARRRAADVLEADPADLDLDVAAARVRGAPARQASVPLGRLAESEPLRTAGDVRRRRPDVPVRRPRRRRRGGRRDRQGRLVAGSSPSTTPGTMLNPLLAEGQRHGGIAQGVAQALLRGGRATTPTATR